MSPVEIHMVTSTNSRWRKIFSQIFACFLTRCLHRESLQHGNLCHWRHWTPWFICGARGNSLTIRHLVADVSVGDEFARLAFDFAAPDELALTAFHVTHLKQQTAQHKSTLWCRTVLVDGARFFCSVKAPKPRADIDKLHGTFGQTFYRYILYYANGSRMQIQYH